MDWQTWTVGLIVAGAVIYVALRIWLRMRGVIGGAGDCATGCGKCDTAPRPATKRVVMVKLERR